MTAFLKLPPMHPERAIEWFSRGTQFLWGFLVLAVPNMFQDSYEVYKGLLSFAPQQVWGLGAFSAGLIGLGALYVNGNHYRTPLIRMTSSFVSMFIWFCVLAGEFRLPTWQTGLVLYFCLMCADAWSVYRASADAYQSTDMHRKLTVVSGVREGVSSSR